MGEEGAREEVERVRDEGRRGERRSRKGERWGGMIEISGMHEVTYGGSTAAKGGKDELK